MTNLHQAANEYATRPADERFASVAELIAAADHQKHTSLEKKINAKELRAVPAGDEVHLATERGSARLTHWSFGQLARSIAAPAAYLRSLPPAIAADCVNYGLQNTPPASDFNLLIQAPNGRPEPTIRACTSESYGRVWDADLFSSIKRTILDRDSRWTTPPTWSGEAAGAYRGDRDSFLILVNGGSIVPDPSLAGKSFGIPAAQAGTGSAAMDRDASNPEHMYRGIMVRNSEVGAASIVIDQILFRYICGNHIIWGAVIDKSYRRRHVGKDSALRDTTREISRIAFEWTNAGAGRDEALIKELITRQIATTKEGVIDELRGIGFSKEQATIAYDTAERQEYASPRSFWGLAQGATRASQAGSSGYQDQRLELDQLAAKVLSKGAALVRV